MTALTGSVAGLPAAVRLPTGAGGRASPVAVRADAMTPVAAPTAQVVDRAMPVGATRGGAQAVRAGRHDHL